MLTVKDAQGCINSDSVILKSPAKIKLGLSVENTGCTPDGKIVASAKDGIPPYLFSLNNGNFETSAHFTNLSQGNYKIAVKDSNNCIVSSDAAVLLAENCTTEVSCSPNPSNSFFKITVGDNLVSDHIQIRVYGGSDKLVYSTQGTHKKSYTFGNNFTRGVYFVEVGTETKVYKFEIIKD